jgi:hypothetical protein
MTSYSTVLAMSRRGIVRPVFSITIALRLRGTPGTLVYLVFGLVVLALIMIDRSDRSRQAQWPDDLP